MFEVIPEVPASSDKIEQKDSPSYFSMTLISMSVVAAVGALFARIMAGNMNSDSGEGFTKVNSTKNFTFKKVFREDSGKYVIDGFEKL